LIQATAARVLDWERVFAWATERFVSPLLWVRLKEAGAAEAVPDRPAQWFSDLYYQTAAANALRLKRMLAVTSPLRDRGVELLYFKGASLLLHGLYPDLGCRIMADVDVLGRRPERGEITRAFQESKWWEQRYDHVMQEWEVSVWGDDAGNLVEVHWELQPHNGARVGAAEERLWAHAVCLEQRDGRVLVPSLEDCFIQAALHASSHHYFDSMYVFPGSADLALLASRAEHFDWDRVVRDLAAERMLEHAAVAVGLAQGLTRFAPLAAVLGELVARSPGLQETIGPLTRALMPMVRKPWRFMGFHERRLLARKPWREWARYLFFGLKRRWDAGKRGKKGEGGRPGPRPGGRKLLDLDFWRFLVALFYFDRRIGYKFYVGPEESRIFPAPNHEGARREGEGP
jgi:hypothetical protein